MESLRAILNTGFGLLFISVGVVLAYFALTRLSRLPNLNSYVGAGLLALLSATVVSFLGNGLVQAHHLDKAAFPVEASTEVAFAGGADAAPAKIDPIEPLLAAANPEAGAAKAKQQCGTCHTFEKGGKNGQGPNLFGIVGGPKAHAEGFRYSPAMQAAAKDGPWTCEEVNQFIVNPRAHIKGTAMSYAGLRSATDRANVIKFLTQQADAARCG
jgi:cytochrome c